VAGGSAAINWLSPSVLPRAPHIDANHSLWAIELPAVNEPLRASTDADFVIIGGGLTGLSAAYYLRLRAPGRRVIVLEARRCGNGASGRNGAMLLTSTADRYLTASNDPAMDRRIHELTVANMNRLGELSLTTNIDPYIDLDGALHTELGQSSARDAMATAARLRDSGIPAEYWDRERTADAIGTRLYSGAIFNPLAGQVHPGRLVAMWKRAAQLAGAEIFENSAVLQVEEGAIHSVRIQSGLVVRAPVLLLATNAYGRQLGYLGAAAAGVWDYMAATAPLTTTQLDSLGWRSRAPYDDSHTETYYLGVTRDQRVHIGGGPVDYLFNDGTPDDSLQLARHQALHAMLARLYPSLAEVPFELRWGGIVDMSLDSSPAIGRMGRRDNIYYAIGYSGHGVNLTSVFGRISADLMTGLEGEWNWFPYLGRRPPYLPNEPFRWLGIKARLAAIRWSESR
jgi:glycine/D-amino acid oxidase-like deaminating enzyme